MTTPPSDQQPPSPVPGLSAKQKLGIGCSAALSGVFLLGFLGAVLHPDAGPSAPPAGSCAPHTVGSCGWDVGVPPQQAGETATCSDGSVSFSATFSGTCSHHQGVRYWYR